MTLYENHPMPNTKVLQSKKAAQQKALHNTLKGKYQQPLLAESKH